MSLTHFILVWLTGAVSGFCLCVLLARMFWAEEVRQLNAKLECARQGSVSW